MGGHRPRKLIGAHRDWLLERAMRDFTLRGLQAELTERGMTVDYRTVWSFVHDEGLNFKNIWPAPSARGLSKTHDGLHQRIRSQG